MFKVTKNATPIKHYLAQIEERNGEREYSMTVKFKTEGEPQIMLDNIARNWYAGPPDEDTGEDVYYFNGGEVCVSVGTHSEITEEMFNALPPFITELNGSAHGQ